MIAEALGGFLVNISSSYVHEKKIKIDDRILHTKIEDVVTEFQKEFEGTELDSLAFQKVLESKEFTDRILQKMFFGYIGTGETIQQFITDISDEVIEKVNRHYESIGRSPVKVPQDFHLYFQKLINVLSEIRTGIFSLKESAMLTTITSKVVESGAEIKDGISAVIEQIENSKEDNIFANNQLENIENLIDQYKIDLAKEFISEMLESQNSLSKPQRELLYFQKARTLVLSSEFEKLDQIKVRIRSISVDSKYIHEIDYHIACNDLNDELFEEVIMNLNRLGCSQNEITMKRLDYLMYQKKIDDVYKELIDKEELKVEYKKNHKSYYYLGIIEMERNNLEKAEINFTEAYKLRTNSMYRFFSIYCRARINLGKFFKQIDPDEQLFSEIECSIKEMKTFIHVTNFVDEELMKSYWLVHLNLLLLVDGKLALYELENVPSKIKDSNIFCHLKADIMVKNGDYNNAKIVLLDSWEETPINVFNLFNILYFEKEFEDLCNRFKELNNQDIVKDPIIQLIYYKSMIEVEGADSSSEALYDLISTYSEELTLYPDIIEISLKHKLNSLFELVKEKTLLNKEKMHWRLLIQIGRILIACNQLELARVILESRAVDNEKLLAVYIAAFKEGINHTTQLLLRNNLTLFYEKGYKYRSLLENLIIVNYELNDFKGNYFLALDDYKRLIGLDVFYSRFFILGKLNTSHIDSYEKEMKVLLEEDIPQDLQLAARMKSAQSDFERSEEISIRALYLMKDELIMDALKNHVSLYFSKMTHGNEKVNLMKPQVNSVLVLKSSNELRKIAIHGDRSLSFTSGEVIFDCENYHLDDYLSLRLVSLGAIGKEIEIEGSKYEIQEILHLGVYLFRYCLDLVKESEQSEVFMKVISAGDVNDFKRQLLESLHEQKNVIQKQMKLYNFQENDAGIPVSYISGKDLKRYSEVLIGIFNTTDQALYSGKPYLVKSEKYVLSLSTILLLNYLGVLKNLEKIIDKVIIVENVENKVKQIIDELSRLEENRVGVLQLTEDNQILSNMHSQESIMEQKKFWLEILEFILKVHQMTKYVESNELYDILLDAIFDEEVIAIELCNEKSYCYVVDDLFLSKLGTTVYNSLKTNNMVGLILSEKLIDDKDRQSFFMKLKEHKYEYYL